MATADETGQKVQRILVAEFNDVRLTKMFDHTLLGDFLDPAELGGMIAADLPEPGAGPGVTHRRIGFQAR